MAVRSHLCPAIALLLAAVAGSAAAETAAVSITREDCRRLVMHRPADGVTYQEGVDVYGRGVAPAELPGSVVLPLPEVYVFDVEVRPFDYTDRERRSRRRRAGDIHRGDASTMTLGTAIVSPDGQAYFNGVALHDEAQLTLSRHCSEALGLN